MPSGINRSLRRTKKSDMTVKVSGLPMLHDKSHDQTPITAMAAQAITRSNPEMGTLPKITEEKKGGYKIIRVTTDPVIPEKNAGRVVRKRSSRNKVHAESIKNESAKNGKNNVITVPYEIDARPLQKRVILQNGGSNSSGRIVFEDIKTMTTGSHQQNLHYSEIQSPNNHYDTRIRNHESELVVGVPNLEKQHLNEPRISVNTKDPIGGEYQEVIRHKPPVPRVSEEKYDASVNVMSAKKSSARTELIAPKIQINSTELILEPKITTTAHGNVKESLISVPGVQITNDSGKASSRNHAGVSNMKLQSKDVILDPKVSTTAHGNVKGSYNGIPAVQVTSDNGKTSSGNRTVASNMKQNSKDVTLEPNYSTVAHGNSKERSVSFDGVPEIHITSDDMGGSYKNQDRIAHTKVYSNDPIVEPRISTTAHTNGKENSTTYENIPGIKITSDNGWSSDGYRNRDGASRIKLNSEDVSPRVSTHHHSDSEPVSRPNHDSTGEHTTRHWSPIDVTTAAPQTNTVSDDRAKGNVDSSKIFEVNYPRI